MKTTFILKAKANEIRVPKQYILGHYCKYLYFSENDFYIVGFNTKAEERKVMGSFCKQVGETFWEDKQTDTTYIRLTSRRDKIEDYIYIASFVKYAKI